jgi:hypothetical protein
MTNGPHLGSRTGQRDHSEQTVAQFPDRPDIMVEQALLLKYKLVNLDVLPLYVVLVLAAPAGNEYEEFGCVAEAVVHVPTGCWINDDWV